MDISLARTIGESPGSLCCRHIRYVALRSSPDRRACHCFDCGHQWVELPLNPPMRSAEEGRTT